LPSTDPLTALARDATLADLLRDQGRPPAEIALLLIMPQQLANVGLTNPYIIFGGFSYGHDGNMGGHYYLVDHDDGQTGQNCGLFAIIRLLYVLGQNGVVPRHWWYSLTVQQLRDILVDQVRTGGVHVPDYYRDQGMPLEKPEIEALMRCLGIPPQYIRIVQQGQYWIDKAKCSIAEARVTIELINDLERVQGKEIDIAYVKSKYKNGGYAPVDENSKKLPGQGEGDTNNHIHRFEEGNELLSYMIKMRQDAKETLQKAKNALKTGDFSYLNNFDTALKAS
jgi:hypothetical protein